MTDETGQAMLAALRLSHDRYVNAVGAHIVTLEGVAEILGTDSAEDITALREQRALAELLCREQQAIFERALS